MGLFNIPGEVAEITETFRTELAEIRRLLERLLEIEEGRAKAEAGR